MKNDPSRRSSTSGNEPTTSEQTKIATFAEAQNLTYKDIGQKITILGRDVTMSHVSTSVKEQTGIVHSMRMVRGRILLVLLMKTNGREYNTPKVIEVLVRN